MISAKLDANRKPVALATLNSDGVTVTAVLATGHSLNVSDGTTGSGTSPTDAQRDANRNTALWATSSVDGKTMVELWCDSSGNLLIQST
jgi:hypothetical protein